MTEKLPSIDDFYEELPSADELITEEKLPSVDEFIEPPRPEEEIADEIRKSEEPVDTAPCSIEEQYTEIVRLVNDVRKDIPEIPEIKQLYLERTGKKAPPKKGVSSWLAPPPRREQAL